MTVPMRFIVAAVVLFFAWKGSVLDISWPPAPVAAITVPKPDPEILKWADQLQPLLPRMLPADRAYLSSFYDAMAYVLMRDGDRDKPIVGDTEQFAMFHAGSLQLAIEKANVGKYPGLDRAIDTTFFNAAGADSTPIDKDRRSRLVAACGVLSWAFAIHHE
jgi:hypothetical protein